jgi:hypothetical protein
VLRGYATPRRGAPPDEFFAIARRAIGGGARGWDHTQAAAAQALLAPLPLESSQDAAPRGALDRTLEAPTGWPRPWRSAAELAIDIAARAPLPPLAAFRKRTRKRSDALDRAVLARIRGDAGLAAPASRTAIDRSLRDLRGEPPAKGWRRLRERLAGAATDPGEDA